jgi:hypothetical protein
MAIKTAQLAKDTVNASILADIHHQESQAGLVIWTGNRTIQFRGDAAVIRGRLKNVGPGAATNASIAIVGENPEINLSVFVDSLASGAEFAQSANEDGWLWMFNVSPADREKFLAQDPYFKISYSTIYDRQRITRYPVGSRMNAAIVSFQYFQEFIDLDRDERVLKLSKGATKA